MCPSDRRSFLIAARSSASDCNWLNDAGLWKGGHSSSDFESALFRPLNSHDTRAGTLSLLKFIHISKFHYIAKSNLRFCQFQN